MQKDVSSTEKSHDLVTLYSNRAIAAHPYDLRAPLTPVKNIPSPFYTKLPAEIRAKIYLHAMAHLEKDFVIREDPNWKLSNITPFTQFLPRICFMDRRTFYESVLVYLRTSRIVLGDRGSETVSKLITFLSRFPQNEGFAAVREIFFSKAFYQYECQARFKFPEILNRYPATLIHMLPGLKELDVAFTSFSVAEYVNGKVDRVYTMEELASQFRLDGLFGNGPSRRLIVRCIDWESDSKNSVPNGRWMFDNLIMLLRDGHVRYKCKAQLEVQWVDPWPLE